MTGGHNGGGLGYAKVAKALLTVDRNLTGWRHQDEILDCFHWREIGFGYPARGLVISQQ